MADRGHMIAAIKTYCRAESEGDRDACMALFADDVLHEDPVGLGIRHGWAGLEELWGMAQGAKVELWLTDDVIVCGNEAIALMRCRTGPADARRESSQIVDHFTFDECGKVTCVRAFYNYG